MKKTWLRVYGKLYSEEKSKKECTDRKRADKRRGNIKIVKMKWIKLLRARHTCRRMLCPAAGSWWMVMIFLKFHLFWTRHSEKMTLFIARPEDLKFTMSVFSTDPSPSPLWLCFMKLWELELSICHWTIIYVTCKLYHL